MGQVPVGWRSGSILECAELLSGGTPKTSIPSYWNGEIPWASAKDVSQCAESILIAPEKTISQEGLDNSSTKMIEPFSTVVVARGATTGRMAMFGKKIAMNQTCYALRSKTGFHFYLYCQLREVIGDLVQSAHGSVFDTITTRTFETTDVLLPSIDLTSCFDKTVAPWFHLILSNVRQNQLLVSIRDTLLPRLLSGEVRLKEAEKMIGAAV